MSEQDEKTVEHDDATVLAVDDETRVVEAYELWLSDAIEIRTATSGEQSLSMLDETVDVVLLDRRMPGMSGDEVLEAIREGPHDPRVAMVTAVDPDFDIVDMPFDHYVAKPVDPDQLQTVVDRLLTVETYDRQLGKLYTVTQKLTILEDEKHPHQLAADDDYERLQEQQDRLQKDIDDIIASLNQEELDAVFESIPTQE